MDEHGRGVIFTSLAIGVWIGLSVSSFAADVIGTARITDADTIVIDDQSIRLFGIDAPESGQVCVDQRGLKTKPAVAAEEFLAQKLPKPIHCSGSEIDDYDRLIATCLTLGNENLNEELVLAGHAWAFRKYSDKYVGAEENARARGKGIWKLKCELPWKFRAKRWEVAKQHAPKGCPIKGNISNNGKIYHTPWSREYDRTKITLSKGEQWFCSEKEALEAGWRAPRR